jgi:hypothetical protein
VCGVECLAQQLTRIPASIAAAEHRSEVGERSGPFQRRIATVESGYRLTQQRYPALTTGHDPGGTHRHAESAWRIECAGELELLLCQLPRGLAVAEREVGERGLGPPGQVTRRGDERSGEKRADGQKVVAPFGDSPLRDPQPSAGEPESCRDERSALHLGGERGERLLCRVEAALLDQRVDEQSAVEDAVGGRRR